MPDRRLGQTLRGYREKAELRALSRREVSFFKSVVAFCHFIAVFGV